MPRTNDIAEIRAILETDRRWAVYALGDLAPDLFAQAEWFRAANGTDALALLYRAFELPVLFTLGQPNDLAPLLDEIGDQPMYLSVRPDILALLKTRSTVHNEKAMWRMVLDPGNYRPVAAGDAVRLVPADVTRLQQLYADGAPTGEMPDFFQPDMLRQGIFFGVREGPELVAAAGTHLVGPAEGVAAIGNVYTRRDRRGRGLAVRTIGAVVRELLRMRLLTIALNVNQQNRAAIRVYARLGFVIYCPFYEGVVRDGEIPTMNPCPEAARPAG